MKEKCLNCRFFGTDRISGYEVPVCRRYAPKLYPNSVERFPTTYPEDWCGEWQKDEAERFSEVKNEQ